MFESSTDRVLAWNSSVRTVSRWLAFIAFLIPALGLIGRVTGIGPLSSGVSGWQPMTMVTALVMMLLAAASALRRIGPRSRMLIVSISAALTIAVLVSHVAAGEDLVSPSVGEFFGDKGAREAHMSLGTASSLLLLAALTWRTYRWPPTWFRDAAAAIVFLIAFLALVCYAYGPGDLGTLSPLRSMSVNTAVGLFVLSTSLILSRPETGWAQVLASPGLAGRVTRRQMLYAFVPTFLGFVLVRAIRSDGLQPAAAMALLVVLTVMPLLWLVLRDGRMLMALEGERAERLRLVERHGADLRMQLDSQARQLEASNAQLLAHAQASSARSEVRYRQLFDSIDAGFCVIEMKYDPAGAPVNYRFVEVNAAFARHTGWFDAEGKWILDLVPDREQHWFDRFDEVARTGEPVRFESQTNQLGGRWFDSYAFRVGGAPGSLVGVLFSDVTERRSFERQLHAMNETLEQRVEAAIAEREEAQAALRQSQKMEAIGQLTGGVAHDFNNLLTPILGSLDLLTRRGGLGEREQRLINGALQSAERAKTLVQRLLAFARRQPLQPGPVDVGALVTNMAELVSSTCGPQTRVTVDVARGVSPAIGDVNQLEMAILNLCVNARDAMPEGGRLTIAVAPSRRPPGHPDLPEGSYVRLSVTDDGTGMDPEIAARAIEPFFSTKGIGKGTGLGLSMVHGLAMQLGGALTIHSQPGLGTRIDLFLRAGDMISWSATAAGEARLPAATGRVLVVDDHEQVRATTSLLLQELGFTTEECESGSLAERRLTQGEPFDLVVTDHLMPGLSGADLAARLAATRPEIAVLVVSGYVDLDAIAPGLNFLRKPFRKDELAGAVSGALREHRAALKPVGVSANPL